MKIKKQVCSPEDGETLKKLGVKQDSMFYHCEISGDEAIVVRHQSMGFDDNDKTSAFTAAELVQMNGNIHGIELSQKTGQYYTGSAAGNDVVYHNTFTDACAFKLIKALKNNWITVEEVNQRLLI